VLHGKTLESLFRELAGSKLGKKSAVDELLDPGIHEPAHEIVDERLIFHKRLSNIGI
jgi:hypothetical protein